MAENLDLKKRKRSVLIIDDEPDIREILKEMLSFANLDIVEAQDGGQALKILERKKFDLIITDIKMPSMDGVEFVTNLRQSLINRVTPVVVVSAFLATDSIKKLNYGNAVALLSKPIDRKRFFKAIGEFIGIEDDND